MKNIIIFGASGNLGMYFTNYLLEKIDRKKYNIIACGVGSKYPFKFFNGEYYSVDITSPDDFKKLPKENIFAVVDFAGVLPAYSNGTNLQKYIDVNVSGTLNILEYCRQVKAERIIYMQSWADLNGYLKDKKPLEPYAPRKPIYVGDHAIYIATKSCAVDMIECYHQMYGIKNYIFRLPNIYLYSPEEYYYVNGEKKYISYRYMIRRAINGEPIELWGNPDLGKDIVYVKDLCQMVYLSLFTEKDHGIYNAGTGIKTTMREQIEGIIQVFSPKDHPSKIIYCPKKHDCDDFVMNIQNIKDDLGYEPKYRYIEYLKDYKKEMEKDTYEKN